MPDSRVVDLCVPTSREAWQMLFIVLQQRALDAGVTLRHPPLEPRTLLRTRLQWLRVGGFLQRGRLLARRGFASAAGISPGGRSFRLACD